MATTLGRGWDGDGDDSDSDGRGEVVTVATTTVAQHDRPAEARAVRLLHGLVWALVVFAAAISFLAVLLDDEILRATGGAGVSADDTRVPASYSPVVVVLYVVVAGLVLVLLAFLRGGHNWARHSLAVTFALLAVSTVAVLRAGVPVEFVPLLGAWLALDALVLYLLYRPETSAYVAPRLV